MEDLRLKHIAGIIRVSGLDILIRNDDEMS
jgi:hypothetical protein